jgi:hypothetical protein
MNEVRISLDAEDFKTLIAGGIVNKDVDGVKILLKDIGYSVMYDLLYREMAGKGFVMVKPSDQEEMQINSNRTHEMVNCESKGCPNIFMRKVGSNCPTMCDTCKRNIDKGIELEVKVDRVKKKLKKS